jgi:hypothetical protein
MTLLKLNKHVVSVMLRVTETVHLHRTRAAGCRVSVGFAQRGSRAVIGNGNSWDARAINANASGIGRVLKANTKRNYEAHTGI